MNGRSRSVPVFVIDTDLGCCVAPPGLGDEVCWSLLFVRAVQALPLEDSLVDPLQLEGPGLFTHCWRVEPSGADVIVVDGPIEAAWAAHGPPAPQPGEGEFTGLLVALFHGGLGVAADPPALVRGRVDRVRVVSRLQVRTGERGDRLGWMPGSTWSYDVARSPKYLASRLPDDDAPRRVETGVLVDLTVHPRRGRRR